MGHFLFIYYLFPLLCFIIISLQHNKEITMESHQDVFMFFFKFGFTSLFFVSNNISLIFINFLFSFIISYCFCKFVWIICEKFSQPHVTQFEIAFYYSFFTIPILFLLSGYVGIFFIIFYLIFKVIFVIFSAIYKNTSQKV